MTPTRDAFIKADWHADIVDRALEGFRAGICAGIGAGIGAATVDVFDVPSALMRAQMDAGVPVLSVVLTPHHYQETEVHSAFFRDHFAQKGNEAARAAITISRARDEALAA